MNWRYRPSSLSPRSSGQCSTTSGRCNSIGPWSSLGVRLFCTSPDIPAAKRLIDPFEPDKLRPASYQLTLGKEVHIGGRHHVFRDSEPLILRPHQVAAVTTRETLRIPRFLIARWSLRVQKIYEGLLWTGGPQVDPGWVGQLYCPIYNLAERNVELCYRDGFFTIDFTRTTPVTDDYNRLRNEPEYKKTWFAPVRNTLSEHVSNRLHSAPFEALQDLEELTRFRGFALAAMPLIFVVLGIMVAALSVVAVKPTVDPEGPFLSFWPMTALVSSAVALGLAAGSLVLAWMAYSRKSRFACRIATVETSGTSASWGV